MSDALTQRLNQILPRITDPAFLSGERIGNEIACYIFDYPAPHELRVRAHIQLLLKHLTNRHSQIHVLHLNLLQVVLAYLKQRGLLDKTLKMLASRGDAAVLRALKGPLAAEKLRDFIEEQHQPAQQQLVLLSGVGSVWPMLRAHSLLNCLHVVMAATPLVMFYPGRFDGTALRLFGRMDNSTSDAGAKPYYRAFKLIPDPSDSPGKTAA